MQRLYASSRRLPTGGPKDEVRVPVDPGVHAAKRVVSVTAVSLRVGGEGDQFTGRCSVGEYWRAYDGESSEAVDARWPDVALRPGLPARSSACIYGADVNTGRKLTPFHRSKTDPPSRVTDRAA